MLCALGVQFLDADGNCIGKKGEDCGKIETIRLEDMLPELKECRFQIACDVTNPLYGENGASYIYGPQKGGTAEQVCQMERIDVYKRQTVFRTMSSMLSLAMMRNGDRPKLMIFLTAFH